MARYRVRDEKLLKKAPRNPEGGWLPPDPIKLQKFFDRITDEAVELFGVDEDGDACVLIRIVDNSRQETTVLNYSPIDRRIEESPYHPYGKKKWIDSQRDPVTKKFIAPVHTPAEEEARTKVLLENEAWRRRMIGLNYSIAHGEVERLLREDECELLDRIDAPAKTRAARIKKLEDLKAKWDDPYAYYEKLGYLVDREANTYTYRDEDRSAESKRVSPEPPLYKIEKPKNFNELMKELKTLKAYKPAKEVKF